MLLLVHSFYESILSENFRIKINLFHNLNISSTKENKPNYFQNKSLQKNFFDETSLNLLHVLLLLKKIENHFSDFKKKRKEYVNRKSSKKIRHVMVLYTVYCKKMYMLIENYKQVNITIRAIRTQIKIFEEIVYELVFQELLRFCTTVHLMTIKNSHNLSETSSKIRSNTYFLEFLQSFFYSLKNSMVERSSIIKNNFKLERKKLVLYKNREKKIFRSDLVDLDFLIKLNILSNYFFSETKKLKIEKKYAEVRQIVDNLANLKNIAYKNTNLINILHLLKIGIGIGKKSIHYLSNLYNEQLIFFEKQDNEKFYVHDNKVCTYQNVISNDIKKNYQILIKKLFPEKLRAIKSMKIKSIEKKIKKNHHFLCTQDKTIVDMPFISKSRLLDLNDEMTFLWGNNFNRCTKNKNNFEKNTTLKLSSIFCITISKKFLIAKRMVFDFIQKNKFLSEKIVQIKIERNIILERLLEIKSMESDFYEINKNF